MSTGLNRALLVRTADRLRAELVRDETTGLPIVDELSEADRRELCEVGGGRIAVVAICLEARTTPEAELHVVLDGAEPGLVVRAVAQFLGTHVRRTDLVCSSNAEALLVVAPGLDAIGGRNLAARLHSLLTDGQLEIASMARELQLRIGFACRSQASASGWTVSALGAEAALHASEPALVTTVA